VEVEEWAYVSQEIRRCDSDRFFVPYAALGAVATILLHFFVLEGVYVVGKSVAGTCLSCRLPVPAEALESVALIPESFAKAPSLEARSSLRDLHIKIDLPAMVELQALAVQESDLERPAHESSPISQLYNIYVQQVKARIERIWQRPRAPVEGEDVPEPNLAGTSFQCEAQIEQDTDGTVQEVLLPNCNGTERWRQSLLTAIRQASPLPAPPDQTVFQPSLLLRFYAFSYTAGESEDGYEPARAALVIR
jgi:hypothetical protein